MDIKATINDLLENGITVEKIIAIFEVVLGKILSFIAAEEGYDFAA